MMTMTRFANDESLLIQAQNGDSEAVELYLSAFVPFLNTIAKRFFNPVLSSQELCQAGYIGLMLALQRYDDTQNVHFMTYAMPWVLGEMKRFAVHLICLKVNSAVKLLHNSLENSAQSLAGNRALMN